MPAKKKQPDPAPPKKRGRPPGEPRVDEHWRLPLRVRQMIDELVDHFPPHANGKKWTRVDVVNRAVFDLWRREAIREREAEDHPPGRSPGTSGRS